MGPGIHSPTCGRAGVGGGIQSAAAACRQTLLEAPRRPPAPSWSMMAPGNYQGVIHWPHGLGSAALGTRPAGPGTPVSPLHPSASQAPRLVEGASCGSRPATSRRVTSGVRWRTVIAAGGVCLELENCDVNVVGRCLGRPRRGRGGTCNAAARSVPSTCPPPPPDLRHP